MATIGIAGCVSLLLCGYGINDSLDKSVSYDFEEYYQYDISTTYIKDDFISNLTSLNGLTHYETYEKLYVRVSSDTVTNNFNFLIDGLTFDISFLAINPPT